jgi:hypothetical protein
VRADKALDYQKKKKNERIYGRTAAFIPLIHEPKQEQTRMTYAKILEVLALNPETYTPAGIHRIIKKESEIDPTLGYPLPSQFSEKRPNVPSPDAVEEAIGRMLEYGYAEVDPDIPPETIAGKISYHYRLTVIGDLSALCLRRVQDNLPKYYQSNPPAKSDGYETSASELLFELKLWHLFRRAIDETLRIMLIVKGLAERHYETYPDCPPGRQPRNDFESLSDIKATDLQNQYMQEAIRRIINSVNAGEEQGDVQDDLKKLVTMFKQKDVRVTRAMKLWLEVRREARRKEEEADLKMFGDYEDLKREMS